MERVEAELAGEAQPAPAAWLPDLVVLQVLQLLPPSDVVSVGQVCRRWRQLASREEVWRRRELDADLDDLGDGRELARVVRFAPCLAGLSVASTSWSSARHAARAAVKQALLLDSCKVERLTDVWCHVDAAWAAALLAVHAEHVREVRACHVDGGVLRALHVLARHRALRGLQLWHCDPALKVHAPTFLDEQVEAALEAVDADGLRGQPDAGLRWIDIFDLPQATTLSLLRAHRLTLSEVTLHVGTPAPARGWAARRDTDDHRWPDTCNCLHLQLSACELGALRSLQLDRYGRADHTAAACAAQLADLREALPGVAVRCRQCDDDKEKETERLRRASVSSEASGGGMTASSSASSSAGEA